jgi:hypothetical protein
VLIPLERGHRNRRQGFVAEDLVDEILVFYSRQWVGSRQRLHRGHVRTLVRELAVIYGSQEPDWLGGVLPSLIGFRDPSQLGSMAIAPRYSSSSITSTWQMCENANPIRHSSNTHTG